MEDGTLALIAITLLVTGLALAWHYLVPPRWLLPTYRQAFAETWPALFVRLSQSGDDPRVREWVEDRIAGASVLLVDTLRQRLAEAAEESKRKGTPSPALDEALGLLETLLPPEWHGAARAGVALASRAAGKWRAGAAPSAEDGE